MDTWINKSLQPQDDSYWIGLEELTDGELSHIIYGQPTRIRYNIALEAVVAKTKLKTGHTNFDEFHDFCQIRLGTAPVCAKENPGRQQSWLYQIERGNGTDDILSKIVRIIENNRSSHNQIISKIHDSDLPLATPQFASEADGPFYDTSSTPYHSHRPTGMERSIEGAIMSANLQYKHSFALECSICDRITTQPEPSSTLHLVGSETLAPMYSFVSNSYWVCNEHSVRSLSEVPHLPEQEWLSNAGIESSKVVSSNYADKNLLIKCNLEWLDLGHPRGEMGVHTCREPEIIDEGPIR